MFQLTGLPPFSDYELADSGHFRKLERFGSYYLSRPEPQAIWKPALSDAEWNRLAHATFERRSGKGNDSGDEGNWQLRSGMPEQWHISYRHEALQLKLRLGLTSFKHVGVFPEQADNWNFIYDTVSAMSPAPLVLNLFAYTGAASLAARAAGAEVVHVDAVKPVITWARQNMEASRLDNIRWVVEDALKFAQREDRRDRRYQGIILDPPAYGRGPDGEKWLLEKHLGELLEICSRLLDPEQHFFVINLYSMGFSALVLENLVRGYFPQVQQYEYGELFIPATSGPRLPLGVFLRFRR
ncbi:MAG: class I SAM-dependent methyltransferase [Saprospiraceae bacterium]|nr:class I SAM-dependent methyltransferase [Saprospiraceae bacterium]